MEEKKEKRHIRFVQNGSFWATWFLFLVFLIGGIILLYQGNLVTTSYNVRRDLEDLSLDNLRVGSYVEGTVKYTLCCYGNYDLKDYYVVGIGKDEDEYITVLSQTADSVALEKLPTLGYEWQEDSTEPFQEAEEGYYICGIIEEMEPDSLNYDYLERQFNTTDHAKIDKQISPKYCIRLIDPKNITIYGNVGKLCLFIAAVVFIFVVLPSYRRKVRVELLEEEAKEQYQLNREKTSKSIKHFIENTYDKVSRIIFEHEGKVIQITSKSEIRDVLNCFLNAKYDKVYDDYMEQNGDDVYQLEFVLENEESISSSLNGDNVLLWYGSYNRMDHVSGKKVRTIFQSMEIKAV